MASFCTKHSFLEAPIAAFLNSQSYAQQKGRFLLFFKINALYY
jgi:hypothetical protein